MFPVSSSPGVPVFDTESSGVLVYPRPPRYGRFDFPLFASLRGILFKISTSSVEMLGLQPPAVADDDDKPWAWHDMTAYAEPPFDVYRTVCHALHPDGRTLFVSVPIEFTSPRREITEHTFSLDAGEHLEWTHRGEWMLPFKGQAYYDAELDAWVGLCRHREGLGHVCSCDLVPPLSASGDGKPMPPRWKLCGERLFRPDDERHRGAKLWHMGSSRFCLVEVVARRGDKKMYPIRCVLRMTTFGLRYGKNGELEIAGRMARSSKSANKGLHDRSMEPVAFWM
ncbi:hypothetical protein E2562_033817 [Oryza meyeriana var. granulata]|uniref:DUF1618 domain-containing protein n=1 Tax=Oryza meyeriana var. granulata TaxID=110450 RepID=A0A6G1F145_9ORYZ|nr:hypothetical protein E2562_033817 [Oryza meyeriana var. granulata]